MSLRKRAPIRLVLPKPQIDIDDGTLSANHRRQDGPAWLDSEGNEMYGILNPDSISIHDALLATIEISSNGRIIVDDVIVADIDGLIIHRFSNEPSKLRELQ